MTGKRGSWPSVVKTLVLAIGVTLTFCAHAQESTRTIRLKYRDDGYRMPVYSRCPRGEMVFKKEPAFGTHKVTRAALFLNGAGTNHIGMAWDQTDGKLFLDTNRNLDLTDDDPVVLDSNSFPMNVKVSMPGPTPLAYRIELTSDASVDSAPVGVSIRSAWEGEFDLHGEPWVISVFDNLDGKLDKIDRMLLRRKRSQCPDSPFLQSLYSISVCPELCVEDRLLRFDYHFEPTGDCSDLVLTLKETVLPSGELDIHGDSVKRMVLVGQRNVLLDSPQGIVRVPAGNYTDRFVFLCDSASEYGFLAGEDPLRGSQCLPNRFGFALAVTENERIPLRVGAPVTNLLRVRREGIILTCQNQFVGAGGESYGSLVYMKGQSVNPRITIRAGWHEIASGDMEYG